MWSYLDSNKIYVSHHLSLKVELKSCRYKHVFVIAIIRTSLTAVQIIPSPSIPLGQSPQENTVSFTFVQVTALLKHGWYPRSMQGSGERECYINYYILLLQLLILSVLLVLLECMQLNSPGHFCGLQVRIS